MPDRNQVAAEKFGKLVVEKIKDAPLEWFDVRIKGKGRSALDQGGHHELAKLSKPVQDLIRDCINSAVSTSMFDFLSSLNEMHDIDGDVTIAVNGVDIFSVNEDGLHYELLGEEGWEVKYSKYPSSEEIDEKYALIHKNSQ